MNGEIHIQEADKNIGKDILVDQNTPQSNLAPIQAPIQDHKSTAHNDQPPDQDRPSWVEVTKKTTTNASTRSAPSSGSATPPKLKVEIPISAKTETTSNDFGKLFKRIEDLEKKVAKNGYG